VCALIATLLTTTSHTDTCLHAHAFTAPATKIGTHDGKFHCDEALACAMLSMLPTWSGAAVVRTRNPDALATCNAVVDVGAVYDAAGLRFDHHQKGFEHTLDGHTIKLSSAGLVCVVGRQHQPPATTTSAAIVIHHHHHRCRCNPHHHDHHHNCTTAITITSTTATTTITTVTATATAIRISVLMLNLLGMSTRPPTQDSACQRQCMPLMSRFFFEHACVVLVSRNHQDTSTLDVTSFAL